MHQSIIKYRWLSITFPPLIVFLSRAILVRCSRSWFSFRIARKPLECNREHFFLQLSIIFANCGFTFTPRRFLFCSETLCHVPKRLWTVTAANYTPDIMFGAIDYENITDSCEVVTDCLFQVIIYPILIDVHKGGIQDYITISRPIVAKKE